MSKLGTYFITGATGLAGAYICQKIISQGGKVLALYRQSSRLPKDLGVQWIEGSLFDLVWLRETLKKIDVVIHAAGRVSLNEADKKNLMRDNVEATACLVDAALETDVKRFCHLSSVAVFNANAQNQVFTEKSTWDSQTQHSAYALSKYLAEQEVWRGVAEGLDAIIVNPSVILGVGDYSKSSLQIIDYVAKGGLFYPTGKINLVDARDVAEAIFVLLHSNIKNERFILNAAQMSYQDFFAQVAQNLHTKAPQYAVHKNMWLIWKNIAVLMRQISQNPIWQHASIEAAVNDKYFDSQKIRERIGFEFRPISQSISWACEALKKSKS